MVTADSIPPARVIATAIGLLKPNEEDFNSTNTDQLVVIIEGKAFRNYMPEEKKLKIDGIQVMAASSTSDKVDFVRGLKQRGHMVALINNTGTSDTTGALKEARVGISMGIMSINQGDEEKFDIIDSLNVVFKSGKRIRSNIQKSIQFQFTAYIVSLISFFVALVANPSVDMQSPVMIQELFFQSCQVLFSNVALQILLSPFAFGMEDEDEDEQVIDSLIITNIMWRKYCGSSCVSMASLSSAPTRR